MFLCPVRKSTTRHHTDRFRAYMDQYLPTWQQSREYLKQSPLDHATWSY
ncbi:DUF45 domain-containing protein [Alkalinema sp. FACHB-956]|nr:DUF45 domain-containing protein [Alkalinema sp. FACHB-956]